MTLIQLIENTSGGWFAAILIWSLIWKGIALWKCGRNNQLRWFIAILVLNTLGVLEITYLTWFQRKNGPSA